MMGTQGLDSGTHANSTSPLRRRARRQLLHTSAADARLALILVGLLAAPLSIGISPGHSWAAPDPPGKPATISNKPVDVNDMVKAAISEFNQGNMGVAAQRLRAIISGTYGGLNEMGMYLASTLLMNALTRTGQSKEASQYGAMLYQKVPSAFRNVAELSTEPADATTMDIRKQLFLLRVLKAYRSSCIYLQNASRRGISLKLPDTKYDIKASIDTDGLTVGGLAGTGPLEFSSTVSGDTLVIEPSGGVILCSAPQQGKESAATTTHADSLADGLAQGFARLMVPDHVAILADLGQEFLPESWPRLTSGVFAYQLQRFRVTSRLRWGDSKWFNASLIDYKKVQGPEAVTPQPVP
jgi:hypothetical protein